MYLVLHDTIGIRFWMLGPVLMYFNNLLSKTLLFWINKAGIHYNFTLHFHPGPSLPHKFKFPVLMTSPDGKGVILSGGNITDEVQNTFYELRRKSESNMELVWTLLNQTMAIPREGHVLFTIPDDYCEYYIDDLIISTVHIS